MDTGKKQLLGIFGWFGFEMTIAQRARLIQNAGFQATSLWWGTESLDYRLNRHHEVPAMIRSLGLVLDNVHVSYRRANELWSGDTAVRQAAVDEHLRWLDDCARHEIPIMVMHKSKGAGKFPPNPAGLDSLNQIVRRAETLHIKVAIENTRCPHYLDYLMTEIDSPALGFCYDSSHDRIVAPDEAPALLAKYAHRLLTIHLSDNDGKRDRHWLPGLGVVDWQRIAQVFPLNYTGHFFLEVLPTPVQHLGTPQDFLAQAYQCLEKFVQSVRNRQNAAS